MIRSHLDATKDLLAQYGLSATYDRYVRPYVVPADPAQPPSTSVADKGKGKEKEVPAFNTGSPAAETPGAGDDGEGDEEEGPSGGVQAGHGLSTVAGCRAAVDEL